MAGCGLLAGWVAVSVGLGNAPSDVALTGAFDAASAAVAAAAAAICVLWWRVSGRAPILLAAAAFTVLAATIALTGALAAFAPLDWRLFEAGRIAGLLVVVGLSVVAATSPDVVTDRGPLRVAGLALGTVGVLTLLLFVIGVGVGGLLPPTAANVGGSVVVAAGLIAVAVVCIVRAGRGDRFLFAWLGLMLLGLALVEVTAVVGARPGRPTVGGATLELASLFVGLTGVILELHSAFTDQGQRLLQSLIQGRAAVARVHAQHAAARQQAHDAYSALAAIEGASRTLERSHDLLQPATRAELTAAIGSEVGRIQRLIGAPAAPDARVPFDLAATLRPVVAHESAEGTDLVTDVREGLTAFGRPADTAEAVTRLLRLSRDRAPGRPVLLRTDWAAGHALVRVEDRGKDPVPTTELELAVCAQLLTDQAGELRVEDRGDGGAAYVLQLPAVGGPGGEEDELGPGSETVHDSDQRGQIPEVDRFLAVSGDQASNAEAASSRGHLDDDVRDDTTRKDPRDDRDVEAGGAAAPALDDDDFEVVARDDAGHHLTEQARPERDRHTPPERPRLHE